PCVLAAWYPSRASLVHDTAPAEIYTLSLHDALPISAQVMVGAVLMLIVAGLLEGYGRQLIEEPLARGAVGGTMLVFWIAYFLLGDRKSTRLNSSHVKISYAVFCLKKKKNTIGQCIDT